MNTQLFCQQLVGNEQVATEVNMQIIKRLGEPTLDKIKMIVHPLLTCTPPKNISE